MPSSFEFLTEVGPATSGSGDKPSRSACFRHCKHETPPKAEAGATTLFEVFELSVKRFADSPCIGHRPTNKEGEAGDFTFLTYKETSDKAKAFAASLRAAGVEKKARVAVFGANCCEWMIAMQVRPQRS